MKIEQHLDLLGLDVDTIYKNLPKQLTLSLKDGVLFVSDQHNQQVHVNFLQGRIAFRASQHIAGEHLVKACRLKNQSEVSVLDATCGMGRDSFLLFQSGFKVTATEQNPVVHALLTDGLHRYEAETQVMPLKLINEPAENIMKRYLFDVIYLDPMFPERSNSAKTKKDMQLFHAIHRHKDDNAEFLLKKALQTKAKRVVLKRPLRAELLLSMKPTFQIKGKTCRFDAFQLS
ncbi:MAG: class I SAM-dependent methyltransferase [Marinicella sp.]|nr:class I SAM-dependent methyltransferase [Xanthomonadales bacterium]